MFSKVVVAVAVASAAFIIAVIFRNVTNNTKSDDTFSESSNSQRNTHLNSLASSVRCSFDKTNNKICTFNNIFYVPDAESFIFVLRNDSIISGLSIKDDFKTISLASVENHNNMFMKLQIVIDYTHFIDSNKNVIYIDEPILLMSRFKPDNIMHVIHDDILPIFMTYDSLCSGDILRCVKNNRLMFSDDFDYSRHPEWYEMFSYKIPYSLKSLRIVTCFGKVHVGVSRETLWFQYGFGTPQGPLISSSLNSLTINRFKNFVLNYFKINNPRTDVLNIILLSRKLNRKILNEDFVVNEILEISRNVYPEFKNRIKVHILDPSQNKSNHIVTLVVKSHIFVGMHGSAMIYSLFLPNNAAIVELFPYGIQPQHVSSTRALSQLPGTFYNYLSWRNFKEFNSVGHPDWPPLLGGIKHLPWEEQDQILKLNEVPAVECCHSPAYLYRMFQDTKVDENFPVILRQALFNQKEVIYNNEETLINDYLKETWFFPGDVSNIHCSIDINKGVVSIAWTVPYNLRMFRSEKSISYYVTVKIFSRIVTLDTFSHFISVKLSSEEKEEYQSKVNGIQLWIMAVADDIKGSEVHSYC